MIRILFIIAHPGVLSTFLFIFLTFLGLGFSVAGNPDAWFKNQENSAAALAFFLMHIECRVFFCYTKAIQDGMALKLILEECL